MKCEDVRAAHLAGTAGEAERRHIASCPACQAVLEDLSAAASTLTHEAVWEEPSPELEDQVVGLIGGRTATSTQTPKWFRYAASIAAGVLVVAVGISLLSNRPDWQLPVAGTVSTVDGYVAGWNTSEGTRVALHVEGLEAAPDGYVYELWFAKDDRFVSAGTFRDASNVRLVVGVARKDFPRIEVTLEPLDGDPAPSETVVLVSQA